MIKRFFDKYLQRKKKPMPEQVTMVMWRTDYGTFASVVIGKDGEMIDCLNAVGWAMYRDTPNGKQAKLLLEEIIRLYAQENE